MYAWLLADTHLKAVFGICSQAPSGKDTAQYLMTSSADKVSSLSVNKMNTRLNRYYLAYMGKINNSICNEF